MIILKSLNHKFLYPCNITIGSFDGIHLGHQLILKKLKEKEGKSVVITFINHPQQILNPQLEFKTIYNIDQKLKLLESYDIDIVVLLKFTQKFANLSYNDFLQKLKSKFSFNYLVVGEDVSFGKDRLGNKETIIKLEDLYKFKLEIIKKIKFQDKIISSKWIRSLIEEKNYDLIERLIDRNFKKK